MRDLRIEERKEELKEKFDEVREKIMEIDNEQYKLSEEKSGLLSDMERLKGAYDELIRIESLLDKSTANFNRSE